MKKIERIHTKKTKPSKKLVEKVARQLCEQAGQDPDGIIIWEGEYGDKDYPFPRWQRFTTEAKKLIAQDDSNA